jgi:hypothetical protein
MFILFLLYRRMNTAARPYYLAAIAFFQVNGVVAFFVAAATGEDGNDYC